jgi:hypothetical protein
MKILTGREIYHKIHDEVEVFQTLTNMQTVACDAKPLDDELAKQFISLLDHQKVLDELRNMLNHMEVYGDGNVLHRDLLNFIEKNVEVG